MRWSGPCLLLVSLLFVTSVAAVSIPPIVPTEIPDADAPTSEAFALLDDLTSDGDQGSEAGPAPDQPGDEPGFADRVREAFGQEMVAFSVAGVLAVAASVGGFVLVTRYISPKEALKNPQRSMLYGYIRATPGAHLKQLSEEFGMKTSSILWHIRKLESAELVKSERANGYRVFYPVDGGVEIKRVSRALAALQNENALHIYSFIERHPGCAARQIAERLDMHGGTARWHLRKMRDHGLLDELIQEDASRFYPTPLGNRALEAREGRPVDAPAPIRRPVPTPSD